MPNFPASRLADIAPFHVMELMARARALEAEGLIDREQGDHGRRDHPGTRF